ncbi:hypothetical protein [Dyadobacter sp. CY323]|uniref:hypothetical protein n=1 Tax=Dyadobacter sp. CY323 TaxID=2907302 RepID=UPI001F2EB7F4|nr:hypothetical protein [Dyadobacter sp. CY323]MCE6987596.1 hypothetical protein [Dyadobacter sp. CY323]
MAYGEQVKELLSASSPETWLDHLWTIYTGYMISMKEQGYDPRSADIFGSFKDLVFFFERMKRAGND